MRSGWISLTPMLVAGRHRQCPRYAGEPSGANALGSLVVGKSECLGGMIRNREQSRDCGTQNGGRSVIAPRLSCLDSCGFAVNPYGCRWRNNGNPAANVARLLTHLIAAGAVRREAPVTVSERGPFGTFFSLTHSVACGSSPADRWPNIRRLPPAPL